MTISTIGTGGTYTTLQAWEDACPADITASGTNENWEGELKNQTFTATSGTLLTIGGITTDATHRLILRCEAGASFKDNASAATNPLTYNPSNGAALEVSGGYTILLSKSSQHMEITGVQMLHTNYLSTSGGPSRSVFSSSGNCTIRDCIVAGFLDTSSDAFVNSLFFVAASWFWDQTTLINCTAVRFVTGTGYLGHGGYGAPGSVLNCLFLGFTTSISGDSNAFTATNCVTDAPIFASSQTLTACITGATPSNEIVSYVLTDYTTLDARLKSGAQSIGGGTSAGAPTVDIIGQARS
jgi:hypothetical protein